MTFSTFILYFFISHFIYSLVIGIASAVIHYIRLIMFRRKFKNAVNVLKQAQDDEDQLWN
jgi:predicted small secreted protein